MRGNLNGTAPSRLKQREPNQTAEAVNSHYTIGGSQVLARPAKGWEAITAPTPTKPIYLLKAQTALQSAWLDYLASIDAGHDQGTVESAHKLF